MIFNLKQPIRPNKKISVFRVTGLKILGRVGRHTYYFLIFFSWKKIIILCILKGILPFKMHKIIFFSRKPEKIYLVSPVNLGRAGLL